MGSAISLEIRDIHGQFVPITQIEDLMCFFIAFRREINYLYDKYFDALRSRSEGRLSCATINIPGVGKKTYTNLVLLHLDCLANSKTIYQLCQNIQCIDDIVKLLLKVRPQLAAFFFDFKKALALRTEGKLFCATFNNPFPECIVVNKECFILTGQCLIQKFCECKQSDFKIVANQPIPKDCPCPQH